MENLLTIDEAAEKVKASTRTLRRAIQSGALEHGRVGSHIRISPEALETWVFEGSLTRSLASGSLPRRDGHPKMAFRDKAKRG